MHLTLLSCLGWCPELLLGIVDKLQKWTCWIVGPLLAASLEPLDHCQNVATLGLFSRYGFVRCSSKLAQLVVLCYSRGGFSGYSDSLHYFSVMIPRCYKDVYVKNFFPCTSSLWNSFPIECFPLIYDQSDN